MKDYTFYYYDSVYDFNSDKRSKFSVTASRLSVAFKAFRTFVFMNSFYYFNFLPTYDVYSGNHFSRRVLPSKLCSILDQMRRLPND